MKNVHILPTDQPSRLYLEYGDGDLCLSNNLLPQTSKSNNQHIYITSDEEIKEGDTGWLLENNGITIKNVCEFDCSKGLGGIYKSDKKIILTTDPDLIADGVQSISYHFLEWFVKNPTCEFVEIESWETKGGWNLDYKIIIPQEEPKQEWVPKSGEQVWVKVFSNWSLGKYIGYDVDEKSHLVREDEKSGGNLLASPDILPYSDMPNEPKQETLEEASEKYANKKGAIPTTELEDAIFKQGFIDGAKWQSEKMFSEEEVKDIVDKTIEKFYKQRYADKTKAEMKELWFKNFKKK